MTTLNDVTSSMNAMHLSNNKDWMVKRMEVDPWVPTESESVDEMDINMSEGERETYEIYVEFCSDDIAKAMEIYLSIMSEVVGGHENAFAVLASTMHDLNCFVVNLTRAELEKLVELDNERLRGIYPPYKAA
ncbi:hypothetical protein CTI12_AA358740 [Artemisia annua]|uniref:Uncharacterized protein n=1 Tax=Artemisia annua TaxID=35608 RepID=A0A2U1MFZ6_ARTAN|nr:hypothetical protein CTI12_AA358740 [Artemisia annua]